MSETPAETLKRAAKLMRERAEAATAGPWEHPLENEVTYGYRQAGGRHVATWIANTDAGDGDISEEQSLANAEHIASWHPGVALAIADALDNEAHAAELVGGDADAVNLPDERILKVALTYLGEESP
jgi:hypothetical protein